LRELSILLSLFTILPRKVDELPRVEWTLSDLNFPLNKQHLNKEVYLGNDLIFIFVS